MADLPLTKETTGRLLQLAGHVGFDTLPDQMVNKHIEKGFVFNVMCLGETGLGKSTLMDTLFNVRFETKPTCHTLSQTKIMARTYDLQECNVCLKLTIVDTLGYGDQIDKQYCFHVVKSYLDVQFEKYFDQEFKIKRNWDDFHDSRVHACLYFICPTGHSLKTLDLLCMKALDSKVNIIPIIAKADTISKTELKTFKEKIREELKRNKIQIYQFPTSDEVIADTNATMNEHIPFAVVGSKDFVKIDNKRRRARQYPWGTVQVENENHCDLVKLREALLCTNMEDLREQTHIKHYELYRQQRLEQMAFCDVDSENKPVSLQKNFEVARKDHINELLSIEEEIRESFVDRVIEKQAEMREFERKINLDFEKLVNDYAEEERRLVVIRKNLEDDLREFKLMKQYLASHHNTMAFGKNWKK